MGNIKIYTKVLNWEAVDTYYERQIDGIVFNRENFIRTFCRCGKVYTENKTGCTCGKTNFLTLNLEYKNETSKTSKKIDGDIFSIFLETLSIAHDRTVVKFVYEKKEILRMNGSKIELYEGAYCSDINTNDLFSWEPCNVYKPYFDIMKDNYYFGDSGQKFLRIYNLRKYYPVLFEDMTIFQYPKISMILLKGLNLLNPTQISKKNLYDILEDNDIFDLNYLDMMENYCSQRNKYEGINLLAERSYPSILSEIQKFDKLYQSRPEGLWNYLKHLSTNGTMNVGIAMYTTVAFYDMKDDGYHQSAWPYRFDKSNILSKGFKIEWLDYFIDYIKENITEINKEYLVYDFMEKTIQINDLGLSVDKNTIKKKVHKMKIHKNTLASTLNIPEEKADLFIESFEKSPITSLQLLKDRRKLTKKQREEFDDILNKAE